MSMTLNERVPQNVIIPVGSQSSTITLPAQYVRKRSRIKNVWAIDQAGVAADNTNYLTLSLQDSSSNVYATYDSRAAAQGALTANVASALKLASPDLTLEDPNAPASQQEQDVPAGTQLQLVVTLHGSAVLTKALLEVEIYPA